MASVFSGTAGRNASIAQAGILQTGANQAYDWLDQGQNNALSSLAGGYNTARSDIQRDTGGALSALGTGYNGAMNSLQGAYGQAQGYYAPLASTANRGYDLYADATGVNGADGNSRAQQAFQAGPGYQWQQSQAADQAARSAAGAGITASGNTLAAINDRASQLANQEYGNWTNRLQGWQSLAPQLAQQQAGLATNYGNQSAAMQYGYGQDQGNLISGQGRSLASLAQGYGTGQAGIYQGTAATKAGDAINVADQMGNIVSGGMMAGQQAAANRLNAGMALGNLAASGLGSLFGAPTNGSTLGSRLLGFGGK